MTPDFDRVDRLLVSFIQIGLVLTAIAGLGGGGC